MQRAIEYLRGRQRAHLDWLIEVCRIPSISTKPEHQADVRRAVEWTAEKCQAVGLQAEIHETGGHPLVYAEHCQAGPDAPTYLVYGHTDVQPTGDLALWDADPFEPQVQGEWLVARGSADNKGQYLLYLRAIEAWLRADGGRAGARATSEGGAGAPGGAGGGALPINVKLLIEAEEEIGSPHLEPFIRQNAAKLACDAILISDTGMARDGQPAITRGTRGMVYKEVFLSGPKHDLHSGQFGGAVVNPANALAAMIAALHDADRRVTVPGFYDDVVGPTPAEREQVRALGIDDAALARELGVDALWQGEKGYTPQELRSIRPVLDVNGITAGFQGEGANTIIPARASAKISMRLVPSQRGPKISRAFDEWIRQLTPPGLRVEIKTHGAEADAYVTPADHPGLKAAERALAEAFGETAVHLREGGSLPILPMFKQLLGVECVLLGFASPQCNAHGPNEKVRIPDLDRGAEALVRLFAALGER